jgi:Bacterial Ig-like domain
MKKLLTILFLFAWSANATIYYVRSDGNNTNSGTTNSSGGAFLTNIKAMSVAVSGDSIVVALGGTYIETAQMVLPEGVSWHGIDSSTCIIKSTYAVIYEGIVKMESAEGTSGNQSISGLKFDGSNLTNYNGIRIFGRSNVWIHDCSFKDFLNGAVIYNAATSYITTAPSIYATGNRFYNNRVFNCAGLTGGDLGDGDGQLSIGGQDGMLIYNNVMNQTQRASGSNGWPIKFYSYGFLKGCKIYNNTLTKIPYAHDGWTFAVELWNISGLEFYGNTVQGALDTDWLTSGDYPFSAYIHDNTFSQPTLNTAAEDGILLEVKGDKVIIENNVFKNIAMPVFFVPKADSLYRNVHIRKNLVQNNGIVGDQQAWFIKCLSQSGVKMKDIHIYNNTMTGTVTGSTQYIGIEFPYNYSVGNVDSIYIFNNIMQNTALECIKFDGNSAVKNIFIRNNDIYNVGSIVNFGGSSLPALLDTGANISVNPVLSGTTDTLGTGSPAIDAGRYVGYPYNGSAPDMGYDERGAPDFAAPTIVSTIPTSGATGASTVNPDTVSFSEIMMVDSINSRTFQLKQGSTVIPTTISFLDSVRWTMTPISQLSAFTTYTISVTTNVKDAAGNNLASAFTSTFTTGALVNVPPTVDAGADSTVNYPTRSSVSLIGTATDSDGSIASTLWTLYYGQGSPTITSPTSLTTTVTGLTYGYYVFKLTATDNQGATGSDTVVIYVSDTNNVYSTWNPSDKSVYLTLSNGNKTMADNSTRTQASLVRGTIRLGGKKYWEVTPYIYNPDGIYFLKMGVASNAATYAQPSDNDAYFWCVKPDGNKANNGSYASFYAGVASGHNIGFYFDSAAATIGLRVDGVDKGIFYTGITGNIYQAGGFYNAGDSIVINSGQTKFAYTPPQGYNAVYTGGTVPTTSGFNLRLKRRVKFR